MIVLLKNYLIAVVLLSTTIYRGYNSQNLEFDNITAKVLKGILAIMIVISHLGAELGDANIINSQYTNFTTLSVSLFFFISGFGLTKSFVNKGNNYLVGFVKKKIIRLVPPLLIILLIWIVYTLYSNLSFITIIDDYIKGCYPPPNSWFVYEIMFLYISFYICTKISLCISQNRGGGGYLLSANFQTIVIILFMVVTYKVNYGPYWWNTTPMFCVGLYWAYYEAKILSFLQNKKNKCIYTLILSLTIIVILKWLNILPYLFFWIDSWLEAIAIIIFLYINKVHSFKSILLLGGFSYELYLTHGIFQKVNMPLVNSGITYLSLSIFESILLAFILNKFLNSKK